MIDLNVIENEILNLEKKDTSYATIERLAWLYIVRDHMLIDNKKIETTGTLSGSEFREACSNVPIDSLLNIMSEHMDAIKMLYPREYEIILKKISNTPLN